jgi:putative 4-mercaptohistidine N1-methyltranferase
VGAITFQLARKYRDVVGIDFSRRFIAAARQLQRTGRMTYERIEEGQLTTRQVARVPADIDRSRAHFEVGDATALRDDIGTFDLIVMANLLDRLPDPLRCLRRLASITHPRGRVVISSPYTWLAEYTPRRKWLGGVMRGGKPLRTHDSIVRAMSPHFTLTRRIDIPFTIRDHARKFQWAVADATIWERRA